MLSQKLIERTADGWSQPSLAALVQEWWYLIVLALLIAGVLAWTMVQLVKLDLELRRASRAAARGVGGEDAYASVAYYRARRQSLIRPILFLTLILFFAVYPVLNSWYGLE